MKIFSGNDHFRGKKVWEIRIFEIFEAEKRFPDSGKALY
jgi:hypothetical protein